TAVSHEMSDEPLFEYYHFVVHTTRGDIGKKSEMLITLRCKIKVFFLKSILSVDFWVRKRV
ncbi:hypothetical protein, partial [Porphyromonas sp. HMSC077F02]|uniref:hypothetical protein n=1 Tax=Porphyromonas sp. HMSC077F02 TaxID=1739529 RepID=UPI001AF012FA